MDFFARGARRLMICRVSLQLAAARLLPFSAAMGLLTVIAAVDLPQGVRAGSTGLLREGIMFVIKSTLAVALALQLGAAPGLAQEFPDVRAALEFQRAADGYAFMHRQTERRLGLAHRKAGEVVNEISSDELATAIRGERTRTSAGEFFTPAMAGVIAARLTSARRSGCNVGELESGRWGVLRVNGPATSTNPLPECVVAALPHLPPELEYRSTEGVLVLVDGHANLVVDVLPGPLSFTSTR